MEPTQTREAAAASRSQAMRARGDRPQQRRSAEVTGHGVTSALRAQVSWTDEGSQFSGYASVVDRGYPMWDAFGEYTETVQPGAFGQSLGMPDLDVPLVLNHDSMRRIARTTNGTLQLSEDSTGLLSVAQLDPTDADVAYVGPKMRAGLIDEMSFRFTITSGEWSPDWTQYNITGVDLHRGDVSIVGYGANPYTSASVRDVVSKISRGRFLDSEDVTALDDMFAALATVEPERLRSALERADAQQVVQRLESLASAWRAEHMTLSELLAL